MDNLGGESGVDPSAGSPTGPPAPRPVLCLDDNEWIGESLMRVLRRADDFDFIGWLPSEEGLWEKLAGHPDAILLLDVDVPGQDSFDLTERITARHPNARVLMLSGHLHAPLIDRAITAGAWGYISKNEETAAIVDALRAVHAGTIAFSPSVRDQLQRQP